MNNLTKGTFAVLLLSSAVASADQQYPAADFQPEVLYQNSDYIAKEAPKAAPAKAAPAAAKAVATTEVDSKYPAADFKPEILYHDPNYKPSAAPAKSTSVVKEKPVQSASVEVESTAAAPAATEDSSFTTYLLGLLGLGLAGFFLFKKSAAANTQKTAAVAPVTKSYAVNTGVAKYLHKITGTGVSRYINSQSSEISTSKLTGVAKYLATQPQQSTAKAATGVDKYVRDRG